MPTRFPLSILSKNVKSGVSSGPLVTPSTFKVSQVTVGNNPPASAGDTRDSGLFHPWVGKILWWRKWQSTPVLLPIKFHGQRSLTGYRPWGHKELDMTELLSTHKQNHTYQRFKASCCVIRFPHLQELAGRLLARGHLWTRIVAVLDFPGGTADQNPPASAGDTGSIRVPEDPTSSGAAKPMHHNPWAHVQEPTSPNCWDHVL